MLKLGLYVDHENIRLSRGSDVDYEVLLEYFSDDYYMMRAVSYMVVDENHATDLADRLHKYRDKMRYIGYKVVEKVKKTYYDEETGERYAKANADMDLAIDAIRQSANLDVIVIISGDGDFSRLVEAIQATGKRVIVGAFSNVSTELRRMADQYIDCNEITGIRRESRMSSR